MTYQPDQALELLKSGPTISERWTGARLLMAEKRLNDLVGTETFNRMWSDLIYGIDRSDGLERLLYVDLVIRISSYIKKLKRDVEKQLPSVLTRPLPYLAQVSDTKVLPDEAKPAEVRENVAIALAYAGGDWVEQYIYESLASEDRSQRCRSQLMNQLVARQRSVDAWLDGLMEQMSIRNLAQDEGFEIAAGRLSDMAAVLAKIIRDNRTILSITLEGISKLAQFCRLYVPLKSSDKLPKKLTPASVQISSLLDELLAVDLRYIAEPEAYSVLSVVKRWWGPIDYPTPLKKSLKPVEGKLVSAIMMRAKWGQRSEALIERLTEVYKDSKATKNRLAEIADSEEGLAPDIYDWLKGQLRDEELNGDIAAIKALRRVANQEILDGLSSVLVYADDALRRTLENDIDGTSCLKELVSELVSFSRTHGLRLFGEPGSTVEFSDKLHTLPDGRLPTEIQVIIVKPGVLRQRKDGGTDILVKAEVRE